ncbi:type I Zorya anti-phage system protein ZorB1 [Pseudomonas aeruginosa]|uniref:type I Zorya anti-phage system protein ZorB1 n=1 Tax=Pseudomonas aeruginosa TaxID=287 RepID=UPI00157A4399|nr:type I Zorya anti-phage system protein ZorB1 [Pseudomonas aeruginosa]MCS8280427.1 OmpA family protein [Pseudomonas aeruginosa]HBO3841592.1 OmpA family protein [Pseudomonas aeruginosa]HCF7596861.1 OmpA family protein [Pseudomonas aeruginosa]HEH8441959.1 OmpA family protein [Pseudomonas aeruginosa]HEH8504581.1 OmpA family protein [Pseudomonas aeruginosa]
MFGKSAAPARARDEGEKPFWISFADLMTAMMILFLVVMVASLSSVTQRIQQAEQGEKQRGKDIAKLCQDLKLKAGGLNSTIVVDCHDNRINFGAAGRFGHNQYFLNNEGQQALQDAVPLILDAADSEEGRKWLKQVVIEGFTDTDGSYLYNLHLSLQRSEWVMCSLLDSRSPVQKGLSAERQQQIRAMFLAGGVSFNNAKESKEESRRVELRMQFFGLDKDKERQAQELPVFATSALEKCQLEMR